MSSLTSKQLKQYEDYGYIAPIDILSKWEVAKIRAGQLSLHHPMIVQGSGLNKNNSRRIGFVI